MHRIIGPVQGLYVAAYTFTSDEDEGTRGYSKLCSRRPGHIWDGTEALAKIETGPYQVEYMALVIAIDLAIQSANQPSPNEFV
jgi:hypothetical protein